MKKKFEILMVACLFISAFLLARASAALTSSRHAASSKTCIVLDAGHGGSDPGKVGCNDALEKDINLSIVLKLKTLFENKGYKVVLTRSDDTVPADENSRSVKVEDLRNRVKLITDTNPVMTISIHQNSFPDASVSGPPGVLLRTVCGKFCNCLSHAGYLKSTALILQSQGFVNPTTTTTY